MPATRHAVAPAASLAVAAAVAADCAYKRIFLLCSLQTKINDDSILIFVFAASRPVRV